MKTSRIKSFYVFQFVRKPPLSLSPYYSLFQHESQVRWWSAILLLTLATSLECRPNFCQASNCEGRSIITNNEIQIRSDLCNDESSCTLADEFVRLVTPHKNVFALMRRDIKLKCNIIIGILFFFLQQRIRKNKEFFATIGQRPTFASVKNFRFQCTRHYVLLLLLLLLSLSSSSVKIMHKIIILNACLVVFCFVLLF